MNLKDGHLRLLAQEGVFDVRGKWVEIDLGNYVHVLDKEDRVRLIPWIAPTLQAPEQIIRLSHQRKRKRPLVSENYVKHLREAGEDVEGIVFIVGVEWALGHLRLRTWFAPYEQEDYVDRLLRKGKVIWP